ncbi:MAG: SurA N-terminal domain-containing protein [Novosphingobium sp.]|nr:SurA N-terminal domain-containing protein [Novosphingobium sp.]
MLQFFRRLFSSRLGAGIALGVLALIAIAFASGDIVSSGGFNATGGGGDRVATVGKDRIDNATLAQAASNALENLKQSDPRQSMQGFLAAGGLDRVLDELIDRAAIAAFGKTHGIVASDRLIDSEIAKTPAFQGPDGKFSEAAYRQLIQQRGLSDELVRRDLAQGLVARQILLPASFGATVPLEFATRYASLLRESRKGEIALLPSAAFAPAAPPTDAQLSTYYTAHKERFIRPERRVIRYATFGDGALKAVPAPTEAEIAARYAAEKAAYAPLETRRLTQLVVPTEAAARAVADEVAKGKSLEVAAREKGLSTASLGALGKDALAGQSAPAVADAAFAAAQGKLAAPARSGLGWHLLRVDAIEKRPGRTLDQVRGELTTQVAVDKRRKALNDLTARIEEEFDNGGNLADIAKELGLTLQQTKPVTADGLVYGAASEKAPDVLARALQTAFAMEQENQPQLAEVEPGKTFLVFDVTDIAPSAPAPLGEIRQDVAGAYLLDKGSQAAKAAAATVQAQVRKGVPLATALASLKRPLPPVQAVDMNRQQLSQQGQQVPPPLALMFSMAKGTVKTLAAPQDRGWFVVALKDVVAPVVPTNDPVVAAAKGELGRLVADEYAAQLTRAIRAEVGVARNEAGIRAVRTQLTGGN